jgi:hypothetical protein
MGDFDFLKNVSIMVRFFTVFAKKKLRKFVKNLEKKFVMMIFTFFKYHQFATNI